MLTGSCFECSEPPLQKVDDFSSDSYKNRERAAEIVKRMRGTGLEAWIMDRKRKGQCLFCP